MLISRLFCCIKTVGGHSNNDAVVAVVVAVAVGCWFYDPQLVYEQTAVVETNGQFG